MQATSAIVGNRHDLLKMVAPAPAEWASQVTAPVIDRIAKDINGLWHSLTGLEPKDSKLAICIPVRNEENNIRSFLSALVGGIVPDSAMIQISIVSNGSTDKSPQIIDKFLHDVSGGKVENVPAPTNFDPGMNPEAKRITIGGITVTHYVTQSKGKLIAQNFANKVAQAGGFPHMVSLDADCIPEPDTVAKMYKTLVSKDAQGNDQPLVYGRCKETFASSVGSWLFTKLLPFISLSRSPGRWSFPGPIMGWNVDWLERQGGIPKSVSEDRAIALRALANGDSIGRSEGATWYPKTTDPVDMVNMRRRYLRSVIQLQKVFPDGSGKAHLDEMYPDITPTYRERISNFFREMRENPSWRLPIRFVCLELLRRFAERDERRLAKSQADLSWEKLKSAKF